MLKAQRYFIFFTASAEAVKEKNSCHR